MFYLLLCDVLNVLMFCKLLTYRYTYSLLLKWLLLQLNTGHIQHLSHVNIIMLKVSGYVSEDTLMVS